MSAQPCGCDLTHVKIIGGVRVRKPHYCEQHRLDKQGGEMSDNGFVVTRYYRNAKGDSSHRSNHRGPERCEARAVLAGSVGCRMEGRRALRCGCEEIRRPQLGARLRMAPELRCAHAASHCMVAWEDRDPETGSLHITAVAWHALVLLAFHLRGAGTDDRPKNASIKEAE
jgi:hypothetical protein